MRCSALSLGAHGEHYTYLDKGDWQANLAYRWLRSDRHFIGDDEQEHRQEEVSEVINNVKNFDLTATYAFHRRFSLSVTLPFVTAHRSSLYVHDRTNRATMSSGGLGDLCVAEPRIVFQQQHQLARGRLAVGLVGVARENQ